jgi:hypothetical protein
MMEELAATSLRRSLMRPFDDESDHLFLTLRECGVEAAPLFFQEQD